MEPGIEPIEQWSDMRIKHRFWRGQPLLEKVFGQPIDPAYWAANNPATVVRNNAEKLRDAGPAIFLEVGDADMFWLYEGAEYLHQVLWQERIRHEYRLYLGADHVGRSLSPRIEAAYRFLTSTLDDPKRDPTIVRTRRRIDPLKRRLEEADHYGIDQNLVRRSRNQEATPPL